MSISATKRSLPIKDANGKASNKARLKTSKKPTKNNLSNTKKKNTSQKKTPSTTTSGRKNTKTTKNNAEKNKPTTGVKKTVSKKISANKTAVKKKTTKNTESNVKPTLKETAIKRKSKSKRPITKNTKNKTLSLRVVNPQRNDSGKVSITKRDRLGHLLIEKLLRDEGFQGAVSTDKHILEEYSTDESIFSITPQLVLKPISVEDVKIATQVIARETKKFKSLSLTPRAAGTGFSGGSLSDSIVIDVHSNLKKISDITYRNKSNEALITVESGVNWIDMIDTLARVGYYIPTYSSAHETCAIGGAVGNNAPGIEPNKYAHCSDYVESLHIVLHDGEIYKIEPLNYKQFKALIKKNNTLSKIVKQIFSLLEENEKNIKESKLPIPFNTAGYDIWGVLPQGVEKFKNNEGFFDLTKLITGSQGTIGIVTQVTLRAIPMPRSTTLITAPIFDLKEVAHLLKQARKLGAKQIEAFDGTTFDLALQNPDFFRKKFTTISFYRAMLAMYKIYHLRYKKQLPLFTVLCTFDEHVTDITPAHEIADKLSTKKTHARVVVNPIEEDVLWQIRRSSYNLSKLLDNKKRPAPFLEDMLVPVDSLQKFLTDIQKLWKEFNVQSTMHGHIGNGHLQFYPLLDFNKKTTPTIIKKMSEKFFSLATKHGGTMSVEHNDGIIRTPYLDKLYSKSVIQIFEKVENIFDPLDIFNPGKKVNPRFEIREVIRQSNW